MQKKKSGNKKKSQSNFAKLSIFQPNKYKFKKSCPLSAKGAPVVDYKNIIRYLTFKVKKFYLEKNYFLKKENEDKKNPIKVEGN